MRGILGPIAFAGLAATLSSGQAERIGSEREFKVMPKKKIGQTKKTSISFPC